MIGSEGLPSTRCPSGRHTKSGSRAGASISGKLTGIHDGVDRIDTTGVVDSNSVTTPAGVTLSITTWLSLSPEMYAASNLTLAAGGFVDETMR
jgi:hypothetical protein